MHQRVAAFPRWSSLIIQEKYFPSPRQSRPIQDSSSKLILYTVVAAISLYNYNDLMISHIDEAYILMVLFPTIRSYT